MRPIQRLLGICLLSFGVVSWLTHDLSAGERARQVQIEARVLELDRSDLEDIGIRDITSLVPDLSARPIESQARVRGLTTSGRTLLSAPGITTLSGEAATLRAGGEVPFPTTGAPVRDFGLHLDMTPTVTPDGTILMNLEGTVPTIDFDATPALGTRTVTTNVTLRDGQTAVLGGLLGNDLRQAAGRFPVLYDVPQLGPMFASPAYQSGRSDLVITVTPRLVGGERFFPVSGGFYGQLSGGAGGLELGSTGLGTVITGGGDEVFLLDSDNRLTGPSVSAELGYRLDPAATYGGFGGVSLYGAYEGVYVDGDRSGRVEPGEEDVAITYFGDAPSTGIFLGDTGLEGALDTGYDWHRFAVGARGYRELGRLGAGPVELGLDLGVVIEQAYGDHDGFVQSVDFPGIRSDIRQEIDDTYIGPRFGASLRAYPSDRFRVEFGLDFAPYYRWSDFESRQSTLCDLCPMGEQDVEIDMDGDDTGFAWRASARLGAEFAVTPRLSFFADGSLSHFDGRTMVRNPANPGEDDTHMERIDALDWQVRAGLRFQF